MELGELESLSRIPSSFPLCVALFLEMLPLLASMPLGSLTPLGEVTDMVGFVV